VAVNEGGAPPAVVVDGRGGGGGAGGEDAPGGFYPGEQEVAVSVQVSYLVR
jgi:hypothetical protein